MNAVADDISPTVLRNEPLARHTSWRVGGPADLFFEPSSVDDLRRVLMDLPADVPVLWLGLGSNLLVRDGGIRGAVISTTRLPRELAKLDESRVRAGAGLAIALACDIRIAAKSAFVSTGYARVGLSGDYGIAWLLTRTVGSARARELMFTAERVDAERCERIGLVNRVVDDARLQDEAFALARSLAEGPRVALASMKDNLDDALHIDYPTALHREAERLVRASRTADHKEAVAAFVEKRKPAFTGR